MLTIDDRKYIEEVLQSEIQNCKNQVTGAKHYLECLKGTGTTNQKQIETEEVKIERYSKEIVYIQVLIARLNDS